MKTETILNFCASDRKNTISWCDEKNERCLLNKVTITENLVALSLWRSFELCSQYTSGRGNFSFVGFYHKKTKKLYSHCLSGLNFLEDFKYDKKQTISYERHHATELLVENLIRLVMERHPNYCGPDVSLDEMNRKIMDAFYGRKALVCSDYIEDADVSDDDILPYAFNRVFCYGYMRSDLSTDMILCNCEKWAKKTANQLLENATTLDELIKSVNAYYHDKLQLEMLTADTTNRLHAIKRFKKSIEGTKTVKLNIVHNGIPLSARVNSDYLDDDYGVYRLYCTVGASPKDQIALKQLFATKDNWRLDDMHIEDIVSAEYGGKIIFEGK